MDLQKEFDKIWPNTVYWRRTIHYSNQAKVDEVWQELKKFFEDQGWSLNRTGPVDWYQWIARKDHVKIHGDMTQGATALKTKTRHGGWRNVKTYYGGGSLKEVMKLAEETKKADLVSFSKNNLPPALKFDTESIRYHDSNKSVSTANQISWVRVESIVGLNDDGSISKQKIYSPDEQVWFHLDCQNAAGATFDLISDGETFYPIRRYGKQKITDETNPKSSINLKKMTEFDQLLVKKAIELYISKL